MKLQKRNSAGAIHRKTACLARNGSTSALVRVSESNEIIRIAPVGGVRFTNETASLVCGLLKIAFGPFALIQLDGWTQ